MDSLRDFCDVFITINSHILKLKCLRGLTREIRENKTTAQITTYTLQHYGPVQSKCMIYIDSKCTKTTSFV